VTVKDVMNEQVVNETIPLERRRSIFGVVGDGDAPVPHAVVTLADMAGRKIGSAYSDHVGRYRLDTTTGGTYLLIVSAPAHEPIAALVAVGDQPERHDVTLAGAGGLFGTVRLAPTAAAPSGEPVGGATVTVTDVRGEVVGVVGTEGDGTFSFPYLPMGTYTLVVAAAGHRPVAAPVIVVRGEPTRHDVEIVAAGSLHGSVEAHGTPFEGAVVTLLDVTGQVVADGSTGVSGTFSFADLQPGQYTLVTAGYPPAAVSVQIIDGGPVRADVTVGGDAL
jgi:Carboxypeptidase regulatory-like domain